MDNQGSAASSGTVGRLVRLESRQSGKMRRARQEAIGFGGAIELADGEPCSHPGCANHVTKPCEVCHRKAAMGVGWMPARKQSNASLEPLARKDTNEQ